MPEKIVKLNKEALIEMYLAGVSVRQVKDITEALWSSKVSPTTISELNQKAYIHIENWQNLPLQGGDILMFTWRGYICVATGAESIKMWLFWWQLP